MCVEVSVRALVCDRTVLKVTQEVTQVGAHD
jgi:hypothetical protein